MEKSNNHRGQKQSNTSSRLTFDNLENLEKQFEFVTITNSESTTSNQDDISLSVKHFLNKVIPGEPEELDYLSSALYIHGMDRRYLRNFDDIGAHIFYLVKPICKALKAKADEWEIREHLFKTLKFIFNERWIKITVREKISHLVHDQTISHFSEAMAIKITKLLMATNKNIAMTIKSQINDININDLVIKDTFEDALDQMELINDFSAYANLLSETSIKKAKTTIRYLTLTGPMASEEDELWTEFQLNAENSYTNTLSINEQDKYIEEREQRLSFESDDLQIEDSEATIKTRLERLQFTNKQRLREVNSVVKYQEEMLNIIKDHEKIDYSNQDIEQTSKEYLRIKTNLANQLRHERLYQEKQIETQFRIWNAPCLQNRERKHKPQKVVDFISPIEGTDGFIERRIISNQIKFKTELQTGRESWYQIPFTLNEIFNKFRFCIGEIKSTDLKYFKDTLFDTLKEWETQDFPRDSNAIISN